MSKLLNFQERLFYFDQEISSCLTEFCITQYRGFLKRNKQKLFVYSQNEIEKEKIWKPRRLIPSSTVSQIKHIEISNLPVFLDDSELVDNGGITDDTTAERQD